MSGISLNTGLKALLAAQYSLDTVGNNLANANTPGYSRQRLDLSQALSFEKRGLLFGTGVDALDITRATDSILERRILGQRAVQGRLLQRFESGLQLELAFGELEGAGIGDGLSAFFDAASDLSVSPSDTILQSGLVQGAQTVAGRFNDIAASLGELEGAAELEAKNVVKGVNALADEIAALNKEIQKIEPGAGPANALRDQRQLLISELSELVSVQTTEDEQGEFRVYVENNLLVAGDRSLEMRMEDDADGNASVRLEGATHALDVKGGRLGALLAAQDASLLELQSGLDELAHAFILESNRVHSVGMPASGGFETLTGSYALVDSNNSGVLSDELLADAGLPFETADGELQVNVVDSATGIVTNNTIEIDPGSMTVGEFLSELNAIDGIDASISDDGYLSLRAEAGQRFDFSNRLDGNVDLAGTFGSGKASMGTQLAEPFDLAAGSTLDFAVPAGGPTNVSVNFDAADFGNIAQATAAEVAAALNSDPAFAGSGLTATDVDGRLFVQSGIEGADQSFTLNGGSAVAALGLSGAQGQTIQGSDLSVDIQVSGAYTGETNANFTFVPTSNGTVGTSDDLLVEVYDASGALITTLDVGANYEPGTKLEVGDGIEVSFGVGDLSATGNDRFELEAIADSDTSDVLVAFGLNGMFTGTDAESIAVREDLLDKPELIASSWSGAEGDNSGLLALVSSQNAAVDQFDGSSVGERYGEIISGLGFEVGGLESSLQSATAVLDSLAARRDAVSGVNVDEELVDLVRFEQAYQAAAQFISVVSRLEDELLQIL